MNKTGTGVESRVNRNSRNIAVLAEQVKSIRNTVDRIETNHLVHLNERVEQLSKNCEDKLTKLSDKLDVLENEVVKRGPMAGLGAKVLETIVQAIVITVLVLIGISAA